MARAGANATMAGLTEAALRDGGPRKETKPAGGRFALEVGQVGGPLVRDGFWTQREQAGLAEKGVRLSRALLLLNARRVLECDVSPSKCYSSTCHCAQDVVSRLQPPRLDMFDAQSLSEDELSYVELIIVLRPLELLEELFLVKEVRNEELFRVEEKTF